MDLYLATEDAVGEALGERLVAEVGRGLCVAVRLGGKGNGYLKKKLPELVKLSASIPVLMITDLDRLICAPLLKRQWLGPGTQPKGMVFRVAVREAEAWLMADRDAFASFIGMPSRKVPSHPEALDDPKRTLLMLVDRFGKRALKAEILPDPKAMARVGHGYNHTLCEFVRGQWSLRNALEVSDSLARAHKRLLEFTDGEQVLGGV